MPNSNNDPSRVEIILTDILNKLPIGVNPQSRVEALLILLADAISAGGITIDTQMDPASPNPVSNSAIVAFINSSIATQTANFIGTFQSLNDLENYSGTVTNNDYAFVIDVDQAGNTVFERYKYNSDNDKWLFEYNLNNSSFTAAQWATIQSGFTSADKDKLNGIETQANKTVVDDALSSSSENPVQNKIIKSVLDTKVDKETGKGLSTEDFTAVEKTKLAGLSNYDDAQVRADIEALEASCRNRYTMDETDALLNGKQNTLTATQLAAVNSGITPEKVANYDDCYAVINYNALNHNGIYRGKDLTNVYTIEQIYGMVHIGNFDELFLGDYINISITTTLPDETVKTETVSLMIAAFDYYYNCGDTALTTHHIVLIPRGYGFATTAKMNETNTTTGGYLNSYMHQTVLPCYAKSLKTALNNHLLSHRTILSNTINASTPSMAGAGFTGASTSWAWVTTELQLMTEQQLYGSRAWTSSAYDIGIDYAKLPVFNFVNPVSFGHTHFWLRSVVSSTHFAGCNGNGNADCAGASTAFFVRPLILFG